MSNEAHPYDAITWSCARASRLRGWRDDIGVYDVRSAQAEANRVGPKLSELEDVYEIGLARRLEPLDRIKELGDASVPFESTSIPSARATTRPPSSAPCFQGR